MPTDVDTDAEEHQVEKGMENKEPNWMMKHETSSSGWEDIGP